MFVREYSSKTRKKKNQNIYNTLKQNCITLLEFKYAIQRIMISGAEKTEELHD